MPPRVAAVKSRSEQGSGEAGPQRCTSLEQATSAAPAPPAAQVLVQQRGLVRGDSAMDHVLVSSLSCRSGLLCHAGLCQWLGVMHCEGW